MQLRARVCYDLSIVVLQAYSCILRNVHADDCDQTTRIIFDFTVVITVLI